MLVSIRPLGDWARNVIIYVVLRGHNPYPPRTLPANQKQTRLGSTPESPAPRCLLHQPKLIHVLGRDPCARALLQGPLFARLSGLSGLPTSPAAARAGSPAGRRVPGGSGADPHRGGLLRLADQARARSPQYARATRRAGGPGWRRVRPTGSGGGRGRARVPAGRAHGQPR